MLITKRESISENLGCSMPLTQFDDAAEAHAREIFTYYQNHDIILNESFDDVIWKASNEATNITIPLSTFLSDDNAEILNWIGVDLEKYATYVKTYIPFKFGDITLRTIQALTKTLILLPRMSVNDAAKLTKNTDNIAEFLSLLPGGTIERDSVIEKLNEYTAMWRYRSYGTDSRRVL